MDLHNNFEPIREKIRFNIGDVSDDLHWELFRRYKKSVTSKKFCEKNDCEFLIEALEECYNLGYDQDPNYAKLKFILQKVLLEKDQLPGGVYSQVMHQPYLEENLEDREIPKEDTIGRLIPSKVNPLNVKVNLE